VDAKFSRRGFTRLSLFSALFPWCKAAYGKSSPDVICSINPLIGASTSVALGEGKTFPGPATPFGLVQLGPDTITGGDNAPGYSYEHTTIEGFSHTRMSGVGWFGDFGNLLIMPTTGELKVVSGRADHQGEGWRSRFRHETEVAECGYYAVTLDSYAIRAEMTAAPYAGILRFTFPESKNSRIQIDLARRIGGTSTLQHIRVVNDHTIEGWMFCPHDGGGWGNGEGHVDYKLFFRTEFSKPLDKSGVWSIDLPNGILRQDKDLIADRFNSDEFYRSAAHARIVQNRIEAEGAHLGFFAEFSTRNQEQILVKSGLSFVDLEGARKNLLRDIPTWSFDSTRQKARDLWRKELSKIEISGATAEQQTIFATAMYHCMIDPRKISDSDGRYIGADKQIHTERGFTYRTIFSGWDVFRAELPLMTILNPGLVNDQIASLLELAKLSGRDYLERWEIMNAYSGCMDGDPAIAVIVDAYNKGIRRFDVEYAYAACRQTASGIGSQTNRPSNDFYLKHGYVPDQISWTLDNAYFDWCVGNFASALGKQEDAQIFMKRARNYKNIYDPTLKSMRARGNEGEWMPWKGNTSFGQGCTESNPLQQSWFVPQDIYGLIALVGQDSFVNNLEQLFEKTPPTFGWNPYYNHSNEPVHHIAYLFVYAGKPWLTQKWVRRILTQAYHAQVNGICGNDDVGQMSAWYILSAIGFYPVCPGSNTYILGSPLFSKVTIELDPAWHNGKIFTVVANHNSKENCYVQSVRLNKKPLNRFWITHAEITSGGTLEFEMGPQPPNETALEKTALPPDSMRSI